MRVLRGVVYMTKSSGPRTEPWGTPQDVYQDDRSVSHFTFDNRQQPVVANVERVLLLAHFRFFLSHERLHNVIVDVCIILYSQVGLHRMERKQQPTTEGEREVRVYKMKCTSRSQIQTQENKKSKYTCKNLTVYTWC